MRHLVGALARASSVDLAVWAPPGEMPAEASIAAAPEESRWLASLMAAGGISHLVRQGGLQAWLAPVRLLGMLRALYLRRTDADVYHINWLQCALPLPANGKPALITVLGNDMKLLRFPMMRSLLRRVMKQRKVAICPNADWMYGPLSSAFGDVAEIHPVSFGIDPSWYAIKRNYSAAQPKRWLAVTRLTADKLGHIFEWSEKLFGDDRRELHLFGPMQEGVVVPKWVHYHGAASPDQLAAEWFPTACGLITLSRHAEGRPQVMLEAMAAGLPIVASRMPAHAGIVFHGETGALCDSVESYSTALVELEDPTVNGRLGTTARSWAIREIGSWDDCADRYVRVYRQLLEG